MRADIDKNGVLHIEPETELEAFALSQWSLLLSLPPENGESGLNGKYMLVDLNLRDPGSILHRTEYPMPREK